MERITSSDAGRDDFARVYAAVYAVERDKSTSTPDHARSYALVAMSEFADLVLDLEKIKGVTLRGGPDA